MNNLFKRIDQKSYTCNSQEFSFTIFNNQIISSNQNGQIIVNEKIYDIYENEPIIHIEPPFDNQLITNSNDSIRLFDLQKEQISMQFQNYQQNIMMTKLIPNSTLLISVSDEKLLFFWDMRQRKPFNSILAHSGQIFDLDVNLNGNIVTCGADSFTRIWSLFTYQCLKNLLNDSQISNTQSKFLPNNEYVLVSSLNDKIHLWDWQQSEIVKEYTGHLNQRYLIDIQYFEFEDNSYIISGSEDSRLIIWDAQTQKIVFDQIVPDKYTVQQIKISVQQNMIKVFLAYHNQNIIDEILYVKIHKQ